jgi:peroxiredoxin
MFCLNRKYFGLWFTINMVSLATFATAQNLKPFSIEGDLSGIDSAKNIKQVILMYKDDGKNVSDTTKVEKGKYHFAGQIAEPQLARIMLVKSNWSTSDYAPVLLEPVKIFVQSETVFGNTKTSGSPLQTAFNVWHKSKWPYLNAWDSLINLRESHRAKFTISNSLKDSLDMVSCGPKIDSASKMWVEFNIHYADSHINSPIIEYIVDEIWLDEYSKQKEELFNRMPERAKQSKIGKNLANEIKVYIGHPGPEFSLPDRQGKMVSLSSFRGKYVLLEFWASWCIWCRKESPYLLTAYDKYKDKGFAIFSVSIDKADAKQAWLDAIEKDGTGIWTQTSSLTGNKNAAAIAYGNISAIPANFLLDPQGKIIARNLRGEALDKLLKQLMN